MKALVLLLVCFSYLGGLPAMAQEEVNQGIKVYGSFEDGVIYISNLDGSGERLLAEGRDPHLSPDGDTVVFLRRSGLYLINLATEEETLLLDTATISRNRAAAFPRWHPDGRTIFFDFATTSILIALYAVESDGTNPRLIMENGALALGSWPSPFSPDGRKLLYNDCFDECYTLGVVDLDAVTGSAGTSLPRTRLSNRTNYGAWSPNGRHIAFGDAWGPGLFIADPAGARVQTVLEDVQVGALSWSPDSTRIGFTQKGSSATGASGGIYEVRLDGTGLRSRDAHFDKWEHALPSTVVEERTWGQVKEEQR